MQYGIYRIANGCIIVMIVVVHHCIIGRNAGPSFFSHTVMTMLNDTCVAVLSIVYLVHIHQVPMMHGRMVHNTVYVNG
jgi:hypothetical protein